MKITETIERDCCTPTDLRCYSGPVLPGFTAEYAKKVRLSFCTYCGSLWFFIRRPGEMDYGWERIAVDDLKSSAVMRHTF